MERSFEDYQKVASSLNETNDCAVRAVAAGTGVPYAVVHKTMAAHGRRHRDGTAWSIINAVAEELGYRLHTSAVENQVLEKTWCRARPAVELASKVQPIMVYVHNKKSSHVFTVRDGEVLDWFPDNSRRKVKALLTFTRYG